MLNNPYPIPSPYGEGNTPQPLFPHPVFPRPVFPRPVISRPVFPRPVISRPPYMGVHIPGAHLSGVHVNPGSGAFSKLLHQIMKSIRGEAEAIQFYSRLIEEALDQLHKQYIQHALADEKVHLEEFTNLYTYYTGRVPDYSIQPVHDSAYTEGLFKAYQDELEAYEFYRDIYLSSKDQTVRDIYFRALTDEIEHANRFSFLFLLLK